MPSEKKVVDFQKWSWPIIFIILIFDMVLALVTSFMNINLITSIYLLMLIYSLTSALLFMIVVEIFKLKLFTVIKISKYIKKPQIFEFGFFFFSFLATFFTIFAAGLFNNPEKFLEYLQSTWYFMGFYGIAFACGWYHYILRLDE